MRIRNTVFHLRHVPPCVCAYISIQVLETENPERNCVNDTLMVGSMTYIYQMTEQYNWNQTDCVVL